MEDCEVDNGLLEHLFSLESMGIKKDDKELKKKEKKRISFDPPFKIKLIGSEKEYHLKMDIILYNYVELPWYQDKINLVHSSSFKSLCSTEGFG